MTLAISVFQNIFLLHTKTQDYHLTSNVSQCSTVNVIMQIFFHLKELAYVDN